MTLADQLVTLIIEYESGELSDEDTIKLFSKLVKSGMAWSLQGSYGRMAQGMIDDGWLDSNGKILKEIEP